MDMTSKTSNKSSDTGKPSSDVKSPSKADTSGDNSSTPSNDSKKSSTPARTTSYFSSVSTDEYREGWDSIFNNRKSKKNKAGQSTGNTGSKSTLPLSIKLSNEDFSQELNTLLKEAVRRRAKKDNLRIGKLLNKGHITWNLECKIAK